MTKYIFFKRLLAIIQFILGFIFGISLIAGVAASAGYLYFKKMSTLPEKPIFSEETAKSTPTKTTGQPATKPAQTAIETTDVGSETEPEPKPKPKEPKLPSNAYMAKVTWPQGLSLRSEPSLNAARVGGISYNAKIIILEDTADGQWQRVRLPWSQQEGWVKGGNIKRVSY